MLSDSQRRRLDAWVLADAPRAVAYAASLLHDRSRAEDVVKNFDGADERLLARSAGDDAAPALLDVQRVEHLGEALRRPQLGRAERRARTAQDVAIRIDAQTLEPRALLGRERRAHTQARVQVGHEDPAQAGDVAQEVRGRDRHAPCLLYTSDAADE